MRVLLVTHKYPPHGAGGVERLSEQTARALTERGHQVTVLTRNDVAEPQAPTLLRSTRNGVPVIVIEGGGPLLGRFPHLAPTLERLFEMTLVETNPDVVLISHLINHSPTYVAIAHRWGIPAIVELHDFYLACERAHLDRPGGALCAGPDSGRACAEFCWPHSERAQERWTLRTHMYRGALQQADALTCPSEFVADFFRREFGPLRPPLHVIGNGVDFDTPPGASRPRADPDRPLHIACIGAVTDHKGTHIVLGAIRQAGLKHVRLSLFGQVNPGYLQTIQNMAWGMPETLDFTVYGRFEPEELPVLLTDVDVVVVPSVVWETYSIATREALALGIPVIASRLGALPEGVEHGRNGLLFEPSSELDLAANLSMIDGDRTLLGQLRAGIRPDDWITTQDRISRLEQLLVDTAADFTGTADVHELTELTILRDGLPAI